MKIILHTTKDGKNELVGTADTELGELITVIPLLLNYKTIFDVPVEKIDELVLLMKNTLASRQ